MLPTDEKLIEQCKEITDPTEWSKVSILENKAKSAEAKRIIHNHVVKLYHKEEGHDI